MWISLGPDTKNDNQSDSDGDSDEPPPPIPVSPLMNEVIDDLDDPNDPNDLDHPDGLKIGWYHYTKTFGVAVFYGITICIFLTILITVLTRSSDTLFIGFFVIVPAFTGLLGIILLSLMIETVSSEKNRWLQVVLQFMNIGFFIIGWVPFTFLGFLNALFVVLVLQFCAVGFYILCALAYRFFG